MLERLIFLWCNCSRWSWSEGTRRWLAHDSDIDWRRIFESHWRMLFCQSICCFYVQWQKTNKFCQIAHFEPPLAWYSFCPNPLKSLIQLSDFSTSALVAYMFLPVWSISQFEVPVLGAHVISIIVHASMTCLSYPIMDAQAVGSHVYRLCLNFTPCYQTVAEKLL